jgi:leucyl aminopeptidase
MQLIITKNLAEAKPELVFFPVLEDSLKIDKIFNQLESTESKLLLLRRKRENFQGKAGQIFVIQKHDRQVVILGSGQKQKLDLESGRLLAGQMANYLKKYQAKNVGLVASSWLLGSQNLFYKPIPTTLSTRMESGSLDHRYLCYSATVLYRCVGANVNFLF